MEVNIGEEKFIDKFRRVALPIAIQSLIAASLNFVDTLLVGRLGEAQIAAVGFSTQFAFIFWMILFGFTGGTMTYISQFFGKNDMVNIRRVTGIAVTISFLIGVGFFFVCVFMPE
jgi:Na+-driven multidrug efflux pump